MVENVRKRCYNYSYWYYEGPVEDYLKFAKWIKGDGEVALIACEYLHILEGSRVCYRCGKETTVIALGVGEHVVIYQEGDNNTFKNCR